jgi:energy-coupling factor transport system substrate-specific component
MKRSLFSTRTLVATALGAALFFVLFTWIKVPSPVPNTDFQVAYGVSAFFAVVFGPVSGFLIPIIGHALSDTILYGSPWWSWAIASGFTGLITGIAFFRIDLVKGKLTKKDILTFNIYQVIANAFAWLIIAPGLDILIYKEAVQLVSAQGWIAFFMNSISAGVVGTFLIVAYAKRQTAQGSLSEE